MEGIEEFWGQPTKLPDFIELENKRLSWSRETFPTATPYSSLQKAKKEIGEIEKDLENNEVNTVEYVDAIMCILDSAGRSGITMVDIIKTYSEKLEINLKRTWKDNGDGTYSHIKEKETTTYKLFGEKLISMMFVEPGFSYDSVDLNEYYIEYKNSDIDSIEEFVNFFFEDLNPKEHHQWLRAKFPEDTAFYEDIDSKNKDF